MTVAYIESSALVKLALTEDHSSELRDALAGAARVTSELSVAEVGRALQRSNGEAGLALARAQFLRFETMPVDRAILHAAAIVEPTVLRTLDAIHVASALALVPAEVVFYSYDARSIDAAHANGLQTASPGMRN